MRITGASPDLDRLVAAGRGEFDLEADMHPGSAEDCELVEGEDLLVQVERSGKGMARRTGIKGGGRSWRSPA